MNKQTILGLVAFGGFVVLGAGLYQLGGKGDAAKDVPLQATADKSKPTKTDEKPAPTKRTDNAARDRKPIERKGRDTDKGSSGKKSNSSGGTEGSKQPAVTRETLGKSVTPTEPTPSAEDFAPASMPNAESESSKAKETKETSEAHGPPATDDSNNTRLTRLLNSAQPQTDGSTDSGNKTDTSPPKEKDDASVGEKEAGASEDSSKSTDEAAGMKSYRISRGDTLALISEIHYGSQKHVDRIMAANPQIKDPDKVVVGMELRIPPLDGPLPKNGVDRKEKDTNGAAGTKASESKGEKGKSDEETYVVQDGDTLYSIAERFYGDGTKWEELFKLNKSDIGDEPSQLRMGQKIKLPGSPKKPSETSKAN